MNVKDKIFQAMDVAPLGPIEVEEWDASVWIRPLTFLERIELQKQIKGLTEAQKDAGYTEAVVVAAGVQDEDGQLIFDKSDWPRLTQKNPGILNWLAMEVMAHNRMSDRVIENARKNSRSARNSILPFPSPGHSEKPSVKSSS